MKKILKIALVFAAIASSPTFSLAQEIKPEYSDLTFKMAHCYTLGGCLIRTYFELDDGNVLYVRSSYSVANTIRIASYDKKLKSIADEKVEIKNLSLNSQLRLFKINGSVYVRYKYEDRSVKSEKLVLRKINPMDISLGEEIVLMQIPLDEKKNGGKIDEGYGKDYIQVLTSGNLIKVYEFGDDFEVVHKRDIDLSRWDYKDYSLSVYKSMEEGVELNYSLTLYHKGGKKTKMLFYDSDDTNHGVSNSDEYSPDILPGYISGTKVFASVSDNGESLIGYVTNEESNTPILTGVMFEKNSDEIENTYTHELDVEWIWQNATGKWKSDYEKSVKKGANMNLGLKMRALCLNPDMSMTFVLNMNYGKIVLVNVNKDGDLNWRTVVNKFDDVSVGLYGGYSPVGLKGFLDIKTKQLGDGRILLLFNTLDGFKMISVNELGDLSEDMTYVYSGKEEYLAIGTIYNGDFSESTSDYCYFMNIYKTKSKLVRVKIPD